MAKWFAAKRYGWGWTPASWQGWSATAVFVISIVVAAWLDPDNFVSWLVALTFALLLVCYRTGERPR